MANLLDRLRRSLQGEFRIGPPSAAPITSTRRPNFRLSSESEPAPVAAAPAPATPARAKAVDEPWISASRKLIPGEALAGYVSLALVVAHADDPASAKVVLALVFCVVTILLRWFGSQDSKGSAQIGVVVISTVSYIALVYSTGGQIFWHPPVVNQVFYGQIVATALGILGPTLYNGLFAGTPA